MKKIMFNDKYGLTRAVLEGRKTQTRRIVTESALRRIQNIPQYADRTFYEMAEYCACDNAAKYSVRLYAPNAVGEEVAIAQRYEELANMGGSILANMLQDELTFKKEYCGAGWNNKMFVKAEYMPHRIKITNVRIERLQDISEEDCLKEGIYLDYSDRDWDEGDDPAVCYRCTGISEKEFDCSEKAFAYLIDKVSGKGTWESNPYVFVYDFELLK